MSRSLSRIHYYMIQIQTKRASAQKAQKRPRSVEDGCFGNVTRCWFVFIPNIGVESGDWDVCDCAYRAYRQKHANKVAIPTTENSWSPWAANSWQRFWPQRRVLRRWPCSLGKRVWRNFHISPRTRFVTSPCSLYNLKFGFKILKVITVRNWLSSATSRPVNSINIHCSPWIVYKQKVSHERLFIFKYGHSLRNQFIYALKLVVKLKALRISKPSASNDGIWFNFAIICTHPLNCVFPHALASEHGITLLMFYEESIY